MDFQEGELKTNKCDRFGKPMETMFIMQISSMIDELLAKRYFYETSLFKKINNLLNVSICKEGRTEDWLILQYLYINIEQTRFEELRLQLEDDCYKICKKLKCYIEKSNDGYNIHLMVHLYK